MIFKNQIILFILGICLLPFINSTVTDPTITLDDDWTVPSYVEITENSGFFSEDKSTAVNIKTEVFDIAWKQINPAKDSYAYTATATIKEMNFGSFNSQNTSKSQFWMRIWASGVDWAPSWIPTYCSVSSIGTDYDGDNHLPLWNSCVWGELKKLYTYLFKTLNMRADPRLKFIYIPGGFNWCEFDFTEIGNYSTVTGYTYQSFNTWFQGAMQDLVDIFGDYSYKLVYTGEDYPFDVDNWPAAKNLLARDAVSKGMGIRNGITEVFNFHLSEIPAYGVTIDRATGYLNFNKSWPLQSNPNRVIGTENECYNDCGFSVSAANLYYAIKMSNLKALQMGVNWLYLVPTASYMTQFSPLYNWIRYSLGKQAQNSFDAWATLRTAQDTYWIYDDSVQWPGKPYIKNLERFLTQRDRTGGAYTKNGSVKKTNIYGGTSSDIGTSYEGRQTDIATGNTTMSFYVDDDFILGTITDIQIKVTFNDLKSSTWVIRYKDGISGQVATTKAVIVNSTLAYKTATFNFTSIIFSNSIGAGNADFEIVNTDTTNDIEILFVRVVKQTKSTSTTTTSGSSTTTTTGTTTSSATPIPASTTTSTSNSLSNSDDKPNNSFKLIYSFVLVLLSLIVSIILI